MPNDSTTEGLNGEIRVGDVVLSNGNTDYSYLVGEVTDIIKFGSPEHESGNAGDDVFVNFSVANYSVTRKFEIEKQFAKFRGKRKAFEKLPLDLVAMPPNSLIRITGLDIDKMNSLVKYINFAKTFAVSPGLWPKERRIFTLPEILEAMEPQYKAARELIEETIIGLKVFAETTDSDENEKAAADMAEFLAEFWDVESDIPTPDYLTDEQQQATVRGLERHAIELLDVGGISNNKFIADVQSLLDAIPAVWENCRESAATAKARISAEVNSAIENLETVKLYSPLDFFLHNPREEAENNEYGMYGLSDEMYKISHNAAYEHLDAIELYLRRDRDGTYDTERGLAEYLHEPLKDKVFSLLPSIEFHGDELYCVAVIKLSETLTPKDVSELKDWWSGQLSDGWGEGLEQHEIKVNHGEELYIRPWTSDGSFFVDTEREFAERLHIAPTVEGPTKTPAEQLSDKLAVELAEYHAEMLTKSKEQIIGLAFHLSAMSDAYFCLSEEHNFTDAQIAALLTVPSPLREVADMIRNNTNESMMMLDTDAVLASAGAKVSEELRGAYAPDYNGKGYIIAESDGDSYIAGALHIEKNDSVNVYSSDAEAVRAAEADGVKLIHGMPFVPDGLYIDTPENRAVIGRVFEEHRLSLPAEDTLRDTLTSRLDANFTFYKEEQLRELSKDGIFEAAAEIAVICQAHEYFRDEHEFTNGQAEFLLKFQNPLEVVSNRWSDGQSVRSMVNAIFSEQERTLQKGGYELAPDNSAKGEPDAERQPSVVETIRNAKREPQEKSAPKNKKHEQEL
ncbi:MAG: DUF3848 domain-containing protein [Oscillospiraceae bacterium]|jgi:hypothetical protein|nr:DUF3848 domain-containing protein [Oscillospiraceae bacterium]